MKSLRTLFGFPAQEEQEIEAEAIELTLQEGVLVYPTSTQIRQKRETTETERVLLPTQLIATVAVPAIFYATGIVDKWVSSVTGGALNFIETGVTSVILECGVNPLKPETSAWLKTALVCGVNAVTGAINGAAMKAMDEGLEEEGEFELEEIEEMAPMELVEAASKGLLIASTVAVTAYGTAKLIQQFGLRKNTGFIDLSTVQESELEEHESEFSANRKTMQLTSSAFNS